jgi:hypothetical protein
LSDPRIDSANTPDPPAISLETTTVAKGPNWEVEDAYWQSAYPERQYARADRGYEYYRSAYRYGYDAAIHYRRHAWDDVEDELRRIWDDQHDSATLPWTEMRDAIHDAWDHVRGESDDDRTHIR